MAAKLSVLYQTWIQPIDGGYRIKDTGTAYIDVMWMAFNWRVVRSYKDGSGYDRGYCYFGNDVVAMLRAIDAALDWDGADNTDPPNWDKNVMTGKYGNPGPYDER